MKTKTALLLGGPCHGETIELPEEQREYMFLNTRYIFTKIVEGLRAFVKWPKSRRAQRWFYWYMKNEGKHPTLDYELTKPEPLVGVHRGKYYGMPKSERRPLRRAELKARGK